MNDTKRPFAPILNTDVDETDPDDRFDDLPTDQELDFNQRRAWAEEDERDDFEDDFLDEDEEYEDDDLEFIEDESSGF